jgi:putative sterol carrier protein
MGDATDEFFAGLRERGYDRWLAKKHGSARFELTRDGDLHQFTIFMDNGRVSVVNEGKEADAVVRADRETFGRMVCGDLYFLTAVLRGELSVEGDPRLFPILRRLFFVMSEQLRTPERETQRHGS